MNIKDSKFIPRLQFYRIIAIYYPEILDKPFLNLTNMTKEDIQTIKNDIKSFKRVRRVVIELINNFPADKDSLHHQEEFIQLSNARVFLTKTILRLEELVKPKPCL